MGDADREQAGDAPAGGLGRDRLVEAAQAVEQLVGRRFHADLDGVVEPVALRLGGSRADGLAQLGGVGQRVDVGGRVGHRQQHVGGEEHLTRRVRRWGRAASASISTVRAWRKALTWAFS